MNSDAAQALAAELGVDLPNGFRQLSAEHLAALAEALAATRETQLAALDEATQQALEHLPAMLRKPVRKVLGV